MSDVQKIEWALSATDRASSVFKGIETSMERLQGAAAKLGVALSAGYFISLGKGAIDTLDHLNDLHKSTNLTVEDLAGLSLLAKQTGTDLDGLAKGINRMSVEMGKNPDKFRELGITATDTKGRFQQFADLFNTVPDIFTRNALAQAVFAKSWAEMAPALSEGGKRIGEILDRGSKLTGATKEMAQEADALNDKWAELTGTGGLLIKLVGPMLPMLNALADGMLKVGDTTSGANTAFQPMAEILRTLIILGSDVSFTFQMIGKDIARAAENVKLIARGDFAGSRALGETFRQDAERARRELDEYQKRIMGLNLTGTAAPDGAPVDPAAARAAQARARDFLDKDKEKKTKDHRAENERAARAIVDGEEQAAKDVTEAWKAWEDIQLKNHKDLTEAKESQWKQIFDEIDAEQERAIEQGKQYLDALEKDAKKTSSFMKDLGFVMTSAFEDAIIKGNGLRGVLQGLLADLAKVVLRRGVTDPLGEGLSNTFKNSGAGNWLRDTFGSSGGPELLNTYATGTNYVPATGAYQLHQGEAVIPAGQNKGGGNGINISVTVNADSQTSGNDIAAKVAQTVRSIVQGEIATQLRPGGAFNPA